MDRYFGTYRDFKTRSKKDAELLLTSDTVVGDILEIFFKVEDKNRVAWLRNRFGHEVGFFDAEFSRTLALYEARGWQMRAILSFVAYTDIPAPGGYWGQVAVMCFVPHEQEAFDIFAQGIAKRMANGMRPDVALTAKNVEQLLEAHGDWQPASYVPLPEFERGTVIAKKSQSFTERMIELGRQGNKGCYVASWLFLIALAAAILFGLHSCGLF